MTSQPITLDTQKPADRSAGPAADGRTRSHQRGLVPRLALVAALGGLLFGYDTAVINGANLAIRTEFATSEATLGFAVGAALIGAAIGALLGGRIADRFGRVPPMRVAAVLFLVSGAVCAFAPHISLFVTGRIIGGFAAGLASVIAPIYIAEIAPARLRGTLGSMQQLAITSGIFVSLLVNAILVHASDGAGDPLGPLDTWQWMFLCMCVPAVLYGACSLSVPESPRYLVAQGRHGDALAVLQLISDPDEDVNDTLAGIHRSLDSDHKPSFRDLLTPARRVKPIVFVAMAFMVLNQFTGINVIFYYSNTLWSAVGFTEQDSFTISAITAIVNIAATVAGMLLIDRVGRKPLLVIGAVGMLLAQGGLAILFGTAPVSTATGTAMPVLGSVTGPLALVCANLFVVAFGVTWGTISWVLLSEMFPNTMRSAGMSVGTATQWISNFIVTITFPLLMGASIGLAYGLFAAFSALAVVFSLTCVKETKGIALEDMHD